MSAIPGAPSHQVYSKFEVHLGYTKQIKEGERPNSSLFVLCLLVTVILNWNPALPLPSWMTAVKLLHLGLSFWTWKMGCEE